MSKSTKTNAIFLAIVLVAGIIALSYPSFMVGAQAQEEFVMDPRDHSYKPDHGSDYGMDSYGEKKSYGQDNYKSTTEYPSYEKDNSYDKSKDSSSVSYKKSKCNNINVNINGFNGLEIGTVPPALNSLAAEAQDSDKGEVGANSLGSGIGSDGSRSSGHDSDSSRLVCINNNDFNVGGEEQPPTPVQTCDGCFDKLSTALQDAIDTFLDEQGSIPLTATVTIPESVNDITALCAFLNGLADPPELTETQIDAFITGFLGAIPMPPPGAQAELETLIDCLIDAGVIIESDAT
jgi:hypothetical protein